MNFGKKVRSFRTENDYTQDEFTNWGTTRGIFFGAYYFLIRFVCPLAILAIFLHQLGVF